ncbi:DUF4331 family protein [Marinibactrum halimedae]|uniref:Uncharacterized protein n=1 Tax=Marinibactrum halimedae TaxID=1444977 RepID=A0AA37T162_9GAMM|nr:DUF4331 family protein [Marinibactrum halimedae]MCD9460281.1 DUF4331 domain-containing protein [Marinibactrum halimedae]GLS24368.1 hypothetical protein GCM10007877_00790 [Marinibactrum halimedae]
MKYYYCRSLLCVALFVVVVHSQSSDHVDGELLIDHPVSDLTDLFAFVSPHQSNRLVVVLNSYPFVPRNGHFSEVLMYSIRIRPASIAGIREHPKFKIHDPEYRFNCTFNLSDDVKESTVECKTPSHKRIVALLENKKNSEKGIQIFAGQRQDPFLFNSQWFGQVVFENCIPPAAAKNDLANLNVLSLVLEFDIYSELKGLKQSYIAIAGELSRKTEDWEKRKILDRVGRPEISNASLAASNTNEDLRFHYNQKDTFNLDDEAISLYSGRIKENIHYYDAIDGVIDWNDESRQSLAELLVQDFLVLDYRKPFSTGSYFSIERAMLRGQINTRGGGRVPGERVINTLASLFINGGYGSAIVDGIPAKNIRHSHFPYLEKPGRGPWPYLKQRLAPRVVKALSLRRRVAGETCK